VNRSRFVQSIEVSDGTIMVAYGRGANPRIADFVLSLRPHVELDGTVVWQCGNAEPPAGMADGAAAPASGFGVTSLEDRDMPASCRSGYGGW
jgi:hypothetical protein